MNQPVQLKDHVAEIFHQHMPFNRLLGMEIERLDSDKVAIRLPWHDNLMGNPLQKILHGGVTAAILDTVGGLMAIMEAADNLQSLPAEQWQKRLAKMSTIDMRVDYLRPGKGQTFIATAEVIRQGSRVAVCRMELHNESGDHIAFGTGTYMVG